MLKYCTYARALVQNGKSGLVVEQSSHAHTLLFTTGQDIDPVVLAAPTTFALNDVDEIDPLENLQQVIVGETLKRQLIENNSRILKFRCPRGEFRVCGSLQ